MSRADASPGDINRAGSAAPDEAALYQILEAYQADIDAGRPADPARLLAAHPELADELRACLQVMGLAGRMAREIREGSDAGDPSDRLRRVRHALGRLSAHSGDSPGTGLTGDLASALSGCLSTDSQSGSPEAAIPETRPTASVLPDGTTVRYFGDYELEGELGRGGMGVVYRARQRSLNRPVALKMLKAGVLAGAEELRRFQNEAEAVALLEHPGIVPIYEVGEHQGQHYFSMARIEGNSLTTLLETYRSDPRSSARLIAELAEAMHHAHLRGVLHRDLKPANILVDAGGHPHITDFGLAKKPETGAETTQSGAILGTPAYMSPEQAAGHRGTITTATDVYGLGAVLYALLTGKAPFHSDSVVDTLTKVKQEPPDPPSRLNAQVPRDLETICLKCLEKDPRRRYASAQALADDLRAWLDSRPIAARRVGLAERSWLWCKRRPAVAALTAATLLALFGGTIGIIAVQAQANRNLRIANVALDEQRRRAEDREQQAIDAVKRFRDVIVKEPKLKNSPDLEDLRKRLLNEPLAFFRALRDRLEVDRGTTPGSLARLAQASFELGSLTSEIGDKQDALSAFGEAMAIYQMLADANPAVTEFQQTLASGYSSIGLLLCETGKPDEALKAFESALGIVQKLSDANPKIADFQGQLANSHLNIGFVLQETGKPAEAMEALKVAFAICQRLADSNSTLTQYQRNLGKCYNNIGLLLKSTGKPTEALKSFELALAIHQKIADANSTVTEFQRNLSATHFNIGLLLSETWHPSDALLKFESALLIEQNLANANPTATQFQNELGLIYLSIGNLLSHTGKPADALKMFQSARAVNQKLASANPTVTTYQRDLAISQMRIGNALRDTGKLTEALEADKAALAIFQKLADANPTVTSFQSNLAGLYTNIGNLLQATGQPAEALHAYESAVSIEQKLADTNPIVTEFQRKLAGSHYNSGLVLSETGKPVDALMAYESALVIQQKLADANPTVTDFQSDLAASHLNIGILLDHTGKPVEALKALETARAIFQKLANVNPTVTALQRDLAATHHSIGNLLDDTGKPSDALKSYEAALAIQQNLTDANPTITAFQRDLANSHNSCGFVLKEIGKPTEAMKSHQLALQIQQKLADANPNVAEFQDDLARNLNNIGLVLGETGQPAEEMKAYEAALAILRKLADGNPTVTEFQRDLARSYTNIGDVLRKTGNSPETLRSLESALAIWQKLLLDHPEIPDFASEFGLALHNLAMLDLNAKRFEKASVRLREAVEWQRKAVAANPRNPTYRRYLEGHMERLIASSQGMGDSAAVAEAERELAELRDSDPAMADLDARLSAIIKGDEQPRHNAERLALAQRAYDTKRCTLAVRLWADALAAEPNLADDRQTQHRYNAACAAALATTTPSLPSPVEGEDKILDEAAKATLRAQALEWLKAELATWTRLLESANPQQRAFIAQTLQHWQEDSDLISVRDPGALSSLPEAEQKEWEALWADVDALLERAHGSAP